ncbi:galactokinase [Microlunatus sp. Y2014]|uniref:galactokinase n=1 Tax=Microlunatus sp. Y2014 TaxID=3418488 RepID=UPI003DA77608
MTALEDTFRTRTGEAPYGTWFAPGRVNLIGEHTDYNDGFCMPFALPHRVTVAAGPRKDGQWVITSQNKHETVTVAPADLTPGRPGWSSYAAGVVWALRQAGYDIAGADLVLESDVPVGAGLSSSAALECAVLTALAELNGLDIAGMDRARLARTAENEFVGAPTGLMDQAASTLCTAGHALFFDCRDLTVEQVPFDSATFGVEVLVLDTNTPHSLVDSEYAERRTSCHEAARQLGVTALREVSADGLGDALTALADPLLRKRVRHVVTENERVRQARQALRTGSLDELAPLLDQSHASMRDDFEITVPTVDLAVETARAAGALGARMTGGGFGGCIIALVPAGRTDEVGEEVARAFAEAGYAAPAWFTATPSAGAGRLR